jgi:ATPase subunit of ABC transporter with duplicated ATPase domains
MTLQQGKVDILCVSHDRRLLREAKTIYHLENGTLEMYGGYEEYSLARQHLRHLREKQLDQAKREVVKTRKELQQTLKRQSKRVHQIETWIQGQNIPRAVIHTRRDQAEKTTARLHHIHSRKVEKSRQLADEAQQSLVSPGRRFELTPLEVNRTYSYPLCVKVTGSSSRIDLWPKGLNFRLEKGDRVGLYGPAGSGKSTLLRLMAEQDTSQGEISGKCSAFYMDQNLHVLGKGLCLDIYRKFDLASNEAQARIRLAAAGLDSSYIFRDLSTFSGGEKMRLALACALSSRKEALFLDEPGNDLDETARLELEEILMDYSGTLVVVSHDLEFLRACELPIVEFASLLV